MKNHVYNCSLYAIVMMLRRAMWLQQHSLFDALPGVQSQWEGQVGPPVLLYYLFILVFGH